MKEIWSFIKRWYGPLTGLAFGVVLFVLAGCSALPGSDFVAGQVKQQGAQAYDEGLANAHWFVCYAASVGSVRRAYADKPEVYSQFCNDGSPATTETLIGTSQ